MQPYGRTIAAGMYFLTLVAGSALASQGTPTRAEIKPFIDASDSLGNATTNWMAESMTGGVCVVDVDGDGWDDLFFPNDGAPDTPLALLGEVFPARVGNALYLNQGAAGGAVVWSANVAATAGVAGLGSKGIGCSAADYDNDGDVDLYVTNGQRGFALAGVGGMRIDGGIHIQVLDPTVFVSATTDGFYECEGRNTLSRTDGDPDSDGIPNFTDVTAGAGAGDCRHGSSSAWGDFDLDGDADLYVGNFVEPDFMAFTQAFFNATRDTLYENNGDGTFSDVTLAAGVAGRKMYNYELDGERVDSFDPFFTDSLGRTVGEDHSLTHVVGFMDYDGDRYPDIFSVSDTPGTISIYHNNQDGTFTDVTEAAGVDVMGTWMGIAWADVDGDGDFDMYNSNFGADWYTKRKTTETFIDLEAAVNNRWKKGQVSNALWRFDGVREIAIDGEPVPVPLVADIGPALNIEWGPEMAPATPDPTQIQQDQARLPTGLMHTEFSFGTAFFDFDNDSYPDLYLVGSLGRGCGASKCALPLGGEQYAMRGAGRLLQNLGLQGMVWRDVTLETETFDIDGVDYATGDRLAIDYHEHGRSCAKGDFNNDGYPDFVITNAGGFDSTLPGIPDIDPAVASPLVSKAFVPGKTFLFINPGYDNGWLKVRLIGTTSNRSALGAVVRVTLAESKRVLIDQVVSGTSYTAQHSLTLMFGLGDESVEKLEIEWPSGIVETYHDVDQNQVLTFTEGSGSDGDSDGDSDSDSDSD